MWSRKGVHRTKWFAEMRDLKVGYLFLVVGGTARHQWVRRRVETIISGRNGRVRQTQVYTASGVFRRPAVKPHSSTRHRGERWTCRPWWRLQRGTLGRHTGSRVGKTTSWQIFTGLSSRILRGILRTNFRKNSKFLGNLCNYSWGNFWLNLVYDILDDLLNSVLKIFWRNCCKNSWRNSRINLSI